METRAERWPSAWQLDLMTASGSVRVRVRNVSLTGLRFAGPRPPRIGERVSLMAMDTKIWARVIRRERDGGALAFDRLITPAQLSNLRQYRDMP